MVNISNKFINPIIPGFYPDPSICRVKDDYYLVTSTFEYFPGVPIFHSKDLVHWEQIGHCLTRDSQLNLNNIKSSSGIFAPSLRYHEGMFYMITTNFRGDGHFYVYTDNPYGEWSEPIYVEGQGFDPDLFFDDDGKVYFIREDFLGHGIRLWEIDIKTGKLMGEENLIWDGFEDRLCEAPHIYKINEFYYLMVAEGGTHKGHMVVMARSSAVDGPYEGCLNNPILSNRCNVLHPIQATGHADLIQIQDGTWWLVFLGIRQVGGYHNLGRETFLAPVEWDVNGWPVVNHNKTIEFEMDAPKLDSCKYSEEKTRDEFEGHKLNFFWNFRRNPDEEVWSLKDRRGYLKLACTKFNLNDMEMKSFVGRRQRHLQCKAQTFMEYKPLNIGDESGLTVIMNEEHHYEIALLKDENEVNVIVRRKIGDLQSVVYKESYNEEFIVLSVEADKYKYSFGYGKNTDEIKYVYSAQAKYLSTEVAGGFTGVYLGMYATSNGNKSLSSAYFDWFEYSHK